MVCGAQQHREHPPLLQPSGHPLHRDQRYRPPAHRSYPGIWEPYYLRHHRRGLRGRCHPLRVWVCLPAQTVEGRYSGGGDPSPLLCGGAPASTLFPSGDCRSRDCCRCIPAPLCFPL